MDTPVFHFPSVLVSDGAGVIRIMDMDIPTTVMVTATHIMDMVTDIAAIHIMDMVTHTMAPVTRQAAGRSIPAEFQAPIAERQEPAEHLTLAEARMAE
jgi:hypothetical protein